MNILTLVILTHEVRGQLTNSTRNDIENTLLKSTPSEFVELLNNIRKSIVKSKKYEATRLEEVTEADIRKEIETPMGLQNFLAARVTAI